MHVFANLVAAAILGIPQEALAAADGGFRMRLLHPDDARRWFFDRFLILN